MTRDECILLGSIAKTHGVRGELILRTEEVSFEPEENWESLFLEIDGIMVPFFISRLHYLRNNDWIISFDGIISKNDAQELIGYSVWAYGDLIGETIHELFYDQLIGYELIDKSTGKRGVIREFMNIPENPVFDAVIDEENILIPAREELILEVDTSGKTILMEIPDGLI